MTATRFDRAVRSTKATALSIAVVIVALRVAYEFGVSRSATPVWLAATLLLAPVVLLTAAYIVFGTYFRRLIHPPPPAMRIRGDAFVVPGSPVLLGRLTMGWSLLGTIFLEGDPTLSPVIRWGINTGAALVILAAAVPLFRGPRMVLTPAGLNIRAGGRRTLAWDDLVPVPFKPLPIEVRGPRLALSIRRPGHDDPGWLLVPLDLLVVEPVFLGSVVEHYVEHPDRRAAIGTAAEYARLTGTA